MHQEKAPEHQGHQNAPSLSKEEAMGDGTAQFKDERVNTISQLQAQANSSAQVQKTGHWQEMANRFTSNRFQPIQKKANNTGLPDNLKSGIENLSGHSMDDVKVHYNSNKPAQLNAHAYAQGSEIHLGSGQEKHLPHEAWHVVQQKQGRVKPTMQMKSDSSTTIQAKVNINDDAGLEKEADIMGAKALQQPLTKQLFKNHLSKSSASKSSTPVQRKVGFEFETDLTIKTVDTDRAIPYGKSVVAGSSGGWEIKADGSKIEFVTTQTPTNDSGRAQMLKNMRGLVSWAGNIPAISTNPDKQNRKLNAVAPQVGTAVQHANEDIYLVNKNVSRNAIQSAPQASGGITLDKMPELFEKLISTKLNHLKRSQTFQNPYAEPVAPQPTGNIEEDEINAEGHALNRQIYDGTYGPLKGYLEDFNHDTKDIGYSVSANSLLMLGYLAKSRSLVNDMVQDIATLTETEEKLQFQEAFGIPTSEFDESTKNLRGLLALVISYIFAGENMNSPAPYSKAIAPVMSRTNFYALYQSLTEVEKKFFTPGYVLQVAQLEDGNVYAGGFYYYVGAVKTLAQGPTRSKWIESIIRGTPDPTEALATGQEPTMLPHDNMSVGSRTEVGRSSSSMGAMTNLDDNFRSGEDDLAVVELRTMPKNQHLDDWTNTALIVFKMFEDLNKTDREKQVDQVQAEKLNADSKSARTSEFGIRY